MEGAQYQAKPLIDAATLATAVLPSHVKPPHITTVQTKATHASTEAVTAKGLPAADAAAPLSAPQLPSAARTVWLYSGIAWAMRARRTQFITCVQ